MTAQRYPRLAVIDGFLPAELAETLSIQVAQREADLQPSHIGMRADDKARISAGRHLYVLDGGEEELTAPLAQAVAAALPELFAGTGVAAFEPARMELQICVHRDGNFFEKHIDTDWGGLRGSSDRMVTAVYYCARQPQRFSGGELAIFPFFGDGEPQLVAPRFNRLVAFPSFAVHAVMPVNSQSGSFDDARFSVNCWIHRACQ